MKKLKYLFLITLLYSCTNIDLVEVKPRPKQKKIEKTLSNKSNNYILNDKELYNQVFSKKHRKINKNLKGVWVTTVLNLDFPSNASLDSVAQKKEIDEIVKNTKEMGLNAIFFQVKPTNDAFYQSKNLPWSVYLTGKEGLKPDYDPLAYFIKKAHENNIELHAWINPYRVSMTKDYTKLAHNNIARVRPDWIFEYGGKLYLNPANQLVVKYLSDSIEEIVKNYDIDGIHLDDYFYPYPDGKKKLPDFDKYEYNRYSKNGETLGDFRREQINNLIKNLSVSIHKIKPELSFGVSPFGIWRNKKQDINGSKTNGISAYDDLYADVVKWMENGWVDYVAPQIYWNIGHPLADYKVLVEWWNDVARRTDTTLYIGEAMYKANSWSRDELHNHRKIRNANDNVKGYILFRYNIINENRWMADEI